MGGRGATKYEGGKSSFIPIKRVEGRADKDKNMLKGRGNKRSRWSFNAGHLHLSHAKRG